MTLTDAGLTYLERYAPRVPGQAKTANKGADLLRQTHALRAEIRVQWHVYLLEMDAFKFDEVVMLDLLLDDEIAVKSARLSKFLGPQYACPDMCAAHLSRVTILMSRPSLVM